MAAMMRTRARAHWPIVALGFLLLGALTGCQEAQPPPRVTAGSVDLATWDFEAQGVVALEGEWEICWNALVSPKAGDCPGKGWERIAVPRLWSDSGVSSPIGGKGIASYRLRLELPSGAGAHTLRVGSPMTSYELFVNGDLAGGSGRVGTTPEEATANLANRNFVLPVDATQIDLLVHVANFDFRGGGLRRTWYVGPTELVVERNARELLLYTSFATACGIVGLVFLAQFAFRPEEKARGWLGLFSALVALRMLPGAPSDLYQLVLGWLSFGSLIRLEYVNTALLIASSLVYLRARVRGVMPTRTTRLLLLTALALVPIHLFAPLSVVLETLVVILILPVLITAVALVSYGGAVRRGIEGAMPTFVGLCVFSIGVVHDVIRTETGLGASIELFPYFVIAWLAMESRALLQTYARVYSRVEALSVELQEANFELQESEEAIVRFVPFGFMRSLGKESIRDVRSGDHAHVDQMSVLHCELYATEGEADEGDPNDEFARRSEFVAGFERCAIHCGGFLSGSEGSGLQAVFPDAAEDAVEAALAMVEEAQGAEGRVTLKVGGALEVSIGIDTGPVVLGVLGSEEQLIRSVVGKPVECAQRLAAAAVSSPGRLLISRATRDQLGKISRFTMRGVSQVVIKKGETPIDSFGIAHG
jgi:adenylate cyclase